MWKPGSKRFLRSLIIAITFAQSIIMQSCQSDKAPTMENFSWMEGRWLCKSDEVLLLMEWQTGKDTLRGSGKVMGGGETENTEDFKIFRRGDDFDLDLKIWSDDKPFILKMSSAPEMTAKHLIFTTESASVKQIELVRISRDSFAYRIAIQNAGTSEYRFGKLVE